MKAFKHYRPDSVDDAAAVLNEFRGRARLMAGGTDLLGTLKDQVHPEYLEAVIDIKNIPGLTGLRETPDGLTIGAATPLVDIAENQGVRENFPLLAQAAQSVASPQIRNMATIGGNICQEPRCWYYRHPDNTFHCLRKDGKLCNALTGENRYHSIFGAARVGDPPCTSACPTDTDIPNYMEKLRAGDVSGAAAVLYQVNPMPAVTGRVCPHFCQSDCNRNRLDESVSIRNVERFLGDYINQHPEEFASPASNPSGRKTAVVGSGPAGLSAAHYLRRAGHEVVVFDRLQEAGGMLSQAIPDYRLPKDHIRPIITALESAGVEFRMGFEIGRDITLAELENDFDALFLAIGAWVAPGINLPGEELTLSALDFLGQVKNGTLKDPGRKVLVIGGGNVAVDAAISAARLGADQVTMACLECSEEMPAWEWEIEQAQREGVTIMPSWGPDRILAENNRVTGAELIRCTSVFNDQCRFAPTFDRETTQRVEADTIILAVGQKVDHQSLDPEKAYFGTLGVTADASTQATARAKVWAGGDMVSGPATVVEAIAAGRRAAASMDRYLRGMDKVAATEKHGPLELHRLNTACLAPTPAARMPETPEDQVRLDREDALGLDVKAVLKEADRCFNCGCVAVSPSDIGLALTALDARVRTNRRVIDINDFFTARTGRSTVLETDEMVLEIEIPTPKPNRYQAFRKFRLRKSIDFPIAGVAVTYDLADGRAENSRIVLGAAGPVPLRMQAAEAILNGRAPDGENAATVAREVVSGALALEHNGFKIQIFETLVRRAILGTT